MEYVGNYKIIERKLAKELQLEDLENLYQVLRDERGWRENEVRIEYIWLVFFNRSFHGRGGILNVKYRSNPFREYANSEKLVKAIFSFDEKEK